MGRLVSRTSHHLVPLGFLITRISPTIPFTRPSTVRFVRPRWVALLVIRRLLFLELGSYSVSDLHRYVVLLGRFS